MTSNVPDFVELASVTEANLNDALGVVQGYLKFASMIWIRALGEPTLDGIIVKHWSRGTAAALRAFCARFGYRELLLRIDRHHSRWSTRRGGYLIPAAHAQRIFRELSADNMIAAMLEPASPYRDLYCLTCVTVPEEDKLVVEVVGPGFDTSDVLRSDLLPHERFEMFVRFDEPSEATAGGLSPTRTYLITPEEYNRSVDDRLAKIGANLKNPAFPREVIAERHQLREDAIEFLRKTNETLLLRHTGQYNPIPQGYLLRFVSGVLRMLTGLGSRARQLGGVSFSGTFTVQKRLVYWDFFPADTGRGHLLYSA